MKKFKQANADLYEISKQEKLAHDMALISEAGDMCGIPLNSLRSKVMRDRHKKMCGIPKNVKSKKSMWSKAAIKAAGGRGKLYNSFKEGKEDNLAMVVVDITSKMVKAIKKNDTKTLMQLYKTLGKIVGGK